MPRLGDLGPGDTEALAGFECWSFGEPWTAVVQEQIRGQLPEAIATGAANGIGIWSDGGQLLGVAAWLRDAQQPERALIPVLAVAVGQELPAVNTWAPNLRKAAKYAREALAVWFDVPVEQVTINLIVDRAANEISAARETREAANAATQAANAATQAAVLRLAGLGLPDRDVATVIGLSHQRVQQLRAAAGQ